MVPLYFGDKTFLWVAADAGGPDILVRRGTTFPSSYLSNARNALFARPKKKRYWGYRRLRGADTFGGQTRVPEVKYAFVMG